MNRFRGIDVSKVVMLHGKPNEKRWLDPELPPSSMSNWFPWVTKQLLLEGVHVWTPNVEEPHRAQYDDFAEPLDVLRKLFDRHCAAVGYSFGAWAMLGWLSEETSITLNRLILVDAWGDQEGRYDDGRSRDLKIDPKLGERIGEIVLLWSSDDINPEVDRTIELIEAIVPVRKRDLPGYGHFMLGNSMTGPEFPELVEEILS